jgi:hypothetical protein
MKSENRFHIQRSFFEQWKDVGKSSHLKTLIDGGVVEGFSFELTPVSEEPAGLVVGSRQHFSNVIAKVIPKQRLEKRKRSRRHCCDVRNTSTIGSHKPDYLMRTQHSSGEHSIVVVGEIKGMAYSANVEFPEAQVGQIMEFLNELMLIQQWRHFGFGFLTDGIRFQFFKASRNNSLIV